MTFQGKRENERCFRVGEINSLQQNVAYYLRSVSGIGNTIGGRQSGRIFSRKFLEGKEGGRRTFSLKDNPKIILQWSVYYVTAIRPNSFSKRQRATSGRVSFKVATYAAMYFHFSGSQENSCLGFRALLEGGEINSLFFFFFFFLSNLVDREKKQREERDNREKIVAGIESNILNISRDRTRFGETRE